MTMAEKLLQMEGALGRKANKQEARVVEKSALERSYAEVVKRPSWRVNNSVRVKVRREETLRNLRKLEHCIVVSWKSSAVGGEDLEKLGRLLANSWGLKEKLGLARLEKNKVLLKFEALEEARCVLSLGQRLLGGLQLGLEHCNPRTGYWVEEELRNEVWVKIVGLLISLWNPTILRRVGEECGGFVAIDPQTETLGELQWAQILVKTKGDIMPCVLEIKVEEVIYYLTLWWELRPVLRKNLVDCGEASGRKSGEVRGEADSRTGLLVEEESESARLETLTLPAEMMGVQESGLGREASVNRVQDSAIRDWASPDALVLGPPALGPTVGSKDARRAGGPILRNTSLGLKLKEVVVVADGPEVGPSTRWRAEVVDCPKLVAFVGLERANLVTPLAQALSRGPQEKARLLDCNITRSVNFLEMEPLVAWETEDFRKQQSKVSYLATD